MKEDSFIDSTAPEIVEILIRSDGKVMWVNVDGVCRFRACRIKTLVLEDQRPRKQDATPENKPYAGENYG